MYILINKLFDFSGIISGLKVAAVNVAAGLIMIFVGILFGFIAVLGFIVLIKVETSIGPSLGYYPVSFCVANQKYHMMFTELATVDIIFTFPYFWFCRLCLLIR